MSDRIVVTLKRYLAREDVEFFDTFGRKHTIARDRGAFCDPAAVQHLLVAGKLVEVPDMAAPPQGTVWPVGYRP